MITGKREETRRKDYYESEHEQKEEEEGSRERNELARRDRSFERIREHVRTSLPVTYHMLIAALRRGLSSPSFARHASV